MKRTMATLAGLAVAIGMVFATVSMVTAQSPKELVARYLAAENNTDEIVSLALNFDANAVHNVILIFGHGMPDERFSYEVSAWTSKDNWKADPKVAKLLEGYEENELSKPEITVEEKNGKSIATAIQQVKYVWKGHKGIMKLTNVFRIADKAGTPVIEALETVYDYR